MSCDFDFKHQRTPPNDKQLTPFPHLELEDGVRLGREGGTGAAGRRHRSSRRGVGHHRSLTWVRLARCAFWRELAGRTRKTRNLLTRIVRLFMLGPLCSSMPSFGVWKKPFLVHPSSRGCQGSQTNYSTGTYLFVRNMTDLLVSHTTSFMICVVNLLKVKKPVLSTNKCSSYSRLGLVALLVLLQPWEHLGLDFYD